MARTRKLKKSLSDPEIMEALKGSRITYTGLNSGEEFSMKVITPTEIRYGSFGPEICFTSTNGVSCIRIDNIVSYRK